jgi:alkylhydroperoxidase family enzyme
MPWIRTIGVGEASGELKRHYDAAIARAGRVYGIVRAMSIAPAILDASIKLYRAIMFAPTGLSRRQREMLAVVVSRANRCHY